MIQRKAYSITKKSSVASIQPLWVIMTWINENIHRHASRCTAVYGAGLLTPHTSRNSHLIGHGAGLIAATIEEHFVVIHPDLSQAHLIASNDLGAFGESVRTLGAEDVAHHRTRKDLQLTAALPHLNATHNTSNTARGRGRARNNSLVNVR